MNIPLDTFTKLIRILDRMDKLTPETPSTDYKWLRTDWLQAVREINALFDHPANMQLIWRIRATPAYQNYLAEHTRRLKTVGDE